MKKNNSDLPENLINKIAELTNGGFILFYVSPENDIKIINRYENTVAFMALHRVIDQYIEAQNVVDIMNQEEELDEEEENTEELEEKQQ